MFVCQSVICWYGLFMFVCQSVICWHGLLMFVCQSVICWHGLLVCVFIGYRCFFYVAQLFQYILVCWNIYVYLRSIASLFLVNEIGREDGARNLKMTQNRTWVKTKHFLFACFLSFSPYCYLFTLCISLSGTINPQMIKIKTPSFLNCTCLILLTSSLPLYTYDSLRLFTC